ncbi:PAS domain S-box-containing protein/diguanylate cyclase (GGDEF) domain-containing protein [Vreelandella subterranea]|uniref:diguanylate cyclase n=1 Tax=Vreelandella subterranea TaxID=416874 RepID=A0A1H9RP71_9GAMM|nr:sensor domain-containing diguanylate cyclase [Halomonas subterranea]SER73893.1 PAS domain S-box-containing protein/diguanylate cyclase (GGDEF) domain-containing protein [Halomonas subterranea]
MNLSSELRLQAIIDGTRAGTWEWNVKTGEVIFNERWATMLGYTLEEIQPLSIETWNRACHPDDLKRSYTLIRQHLDNEIPFYECLCRVRRKDGGWCWIQDRGMLVREPDGTPTDWMMGTHIDVSIEQESRQHLDHLAASVPGILFSFEMVSPVALRFTYVSERSYSYFGLDCKAIEKDPCLFFDAIHPLDSAAVQAAVRGCYTSLSEGACQFRMFVNGTERWFRAVACPIQDPLGKLVWHGMLTDIDDQKQLENTLAYLSITDELTGLFNRRYLTQSLNDAMALYQRYQTPFSLISLDIDHFKQINDSHGHLVGDRVLTKISELMKHRLRATDIVGRMGGEEFLVLLPNTLGEEAGQVAENLRLAINQSEYLAEDNSPFAVSVSGGVLEMTEAITSVEDLLRRSDRLLYEAKEGGRNRVLDEQTTSANQGLPTSLE